MDADRRESDFGAGRCVDVPRPGFPQCTYNKPVSRRRATAAEVLAVHLRQERCAHAAEHCIVDGKPETMCELITGRAACWKRGSLPARAPGAVFVYVLQDG